MWELWLQQCRCVLKAQEHLLTASHVYFIWSCALLPQLAPKFTRFRHLLLMSHLFSFCLFTESGAGVQDLVVRFWVRHFCVPPRPLSPSKSVSPIRARSVSFSLVADMFDGWFTWLLSTQTCSWRDHGLVGVAVLLTKIPIGTGWDLLIGLAQVSNPSRQLLVKVHKGHTSEKNYREVEVTSSHCNQYRIILIRRILSLPCVFVNFLYFHISIGTICWLCEPTGHVAHLKNGNQPWVASMSGALWDKMIDLIWTSILNTKRKLEMKRNFQRRSWGSEDNRPTGQCLGGCVRHVEVKWAFTVTPNSERVQHPLYWATWRRVIFVWACS